MGSSDQVTCHQSSICRPSDLRLTDKFRPKPACLAAGQRGALFPEFLFKYSFAFMFFLLIFKVFLEDHLISASCFRDWIASLGPNWKGSSKCSSLVMEFHKVLDQDQPCFPEEPSLSSRNCPSLLRNRSADLIVTLKEHLWSL